MVNRLVSYMQIQASPRSKLTNLTTAWSASEIWVCFQYNVRSGSAWVCLGRSALSPP